MAITQIGPGMLAPQSVTSGTVQAIALDTASGNGTGAMALPIGTTAQRPSSPTVNQQRYNSTLGAPEYWNGTSWVSALGTSPQWPASSAAAIYSANPGAPSGYYWLKFSGMGAAFQAYCKMDAGGGWMMLDRLMPGLSDSPVITGSALGSGGGNHVGNDVSNPKISPIQFLNGPTVYNSQALTYGCPGSTGRSQILTSADLRTYFGTISYVRTKVFLGSNDGNVTCGYVGSLGSPVMITGPINALSVCNNTPNRWSDVVGANQTIEFYGTPVSQTSIWECWTACGGAFNVKVLEIYIK